MSDILEEINESALSVYKNAYAQRLPEATIPHHYLAVLLQWQEKMKRPENRDFVLSPKCKVRCFRPRERKDENYTIFIISGVEKQVNANYFHCVFAFTFEQPENELINCFASSNLIHWNKAPMIEALDTGHLPSMERLFKEKSLTYNHDWSGKSDVVRLSKEQAAKLEIRVPGDFYLAPLDGSHAEKVDKNWKFHCDVSLSYIQTLIRLNGGFGIFTKASNELVSWVLTNDQMALGFLYTLDAFRHRGLAQAVFSAAAKHLATTENVDSYAYVQQGNDVSLHLLRKIGFERFQEVIWIQMN